MQPWVRLAPLLLTSEAIVFDATFEPTLWSDWTSIDLNVDGRQDWAYRSDYQAVYDAGPNPGTPATQTPPLILPEGVFQQLPGNVLDSHPKYDFRGEQGFEDGSIELQARFYPSATVGNKASIFLNFWYDTPFEPGKTESSAFYVFYLTLEVVQEGADVKLKAYLQTDKNFPENTVHDLTSEDRVGLLPMDYVLVEAYMEYNSKSIKLKLNGRTALDWTSMRQSSVATSTEGDRWLSLWAREIVAGDYVYWDFVSYKGVPTTSSTEPCLNEPNKCFAIPVDAPTPGASSPAGATPGHAVFTLAGDTSKSDGKSCQEAVVQAAAQGGGMPPAEGEWVKLRLQLSPPPAWLSNPNALDPSALYFDLYNRALGTGSQLLADSARLGPDKVVDASGNYQSKGTASMLCVQVCRQALPGQQGEGGRLLPFGEASAVPFQLDSSTSDGFAQGRAEVKCSSEPSLVKNPAYVVPSDRTDHLRCVTSAWEWVAQQPSGALAVGACVEKGGDPDSDNLLVNGDFSRGKRGWFSQRTPGSVYVDVDELSTWRSGVDFTVADGGVAQVMDAGSLSSIFQSFGTEAGNRYSVEYEVCVVGEKSYYYVESDGTTWGSGMSMVLDGHWMQGHNYSLAFDYFGTSGFIRSLSAYDTGTSIADVYAQVLMQTVPLQASPSGAYAEYSFGSSGLHSKRTLRFPGTQEHKDISAFLELYGFTPFWINGQRTSNLLVALPADGKPGWRFTLDSLAFPGEEGEISFSLFDQATTLPSIRKAVCLRMHPANPGQHFHDCEPERFCRSGAGDLTPPGAKMAPQRQWFCEATVRPGDIALLFVRVRKENGANWGLSDIGKVFPLFHVTVENKNSTNSITTVQTFTAAPVSNYDTASISWNNDVVTLAWYVNNAALLSPPAMEDASLSAAFTATGSLDLDLGSSSTPGHLAEVTDIRLTQSEVVEEGGVIVEAGMLLTDGRSHTVRLQGRAEAADEALAYEQTMAATPTPAATATPASCSWHKTVCSFTASSRAATLLLHSDNTGGAWFRNVSVKRAPDSPTRTPTNSPSAPPNSIPTLQPTTPRPTNNPTIATITPRRISISPASVGLEGKETSLLFGQGLICNSIVEVDGAIIFSVPCPLSPPPTSNATTGLPPPPASGCSAADVLPGANVLCDAIYFTPPAQDGALGIGYHTLRIVNNPGEYYEGATETDSLLYYSNSSSCQGFGRFGTAEPCTCPAGACCPGGQRVYPLPGYWSLNEASVPLKCSLPSACPGAATVLDSPLGKGCQLSELAQQSAGGSGGRRRRGGGATTSLCAKGYVGYTCGQCAESFYSVGAGSLQCRSCGAEAEDQAQLVSLLAASVVVLLIEALCVAFLGEAKLFLAVTSILGLQQFLVVGSASAQTMPLWVADAFAALSFLNWDIQFVKPGCSVSRVSVVAVFWVTIAVLFLAALLFIAAAAVRGLLYKRRLPTAAGMGGVSVNAAVTKPFKRRAVHAMVILGYLAYLQLSMRVVAGIHCVRGTEAEGAVLRLAASLDVLCYEGSHTFTAVVQWLLLLFFVLGFPAWAVFISHRSATIHKGKQFDDPKRAQKYGFLYRGSKQRFWYARSLNFPILLALALRPVLGRLPPFVFFGLYGCLLLVTMPYKIWAANIVNSLMALGNAAHALVYMLIEPAFAGEDTAALGITLVGAILTGLLWAAGRQSRRARALLGEVEAKEAAGKEVSGCEESVEMVEMGDTKTGDAGWGGMDGRAEHRGSMDNAMPPPQPPPLPVAPAPRPPSRPGPPPSMPALPLPSLPAATDARFM